MNLSKSRYTKAIQCPKILWMDNHMPECFDSSVLNQSVLDNGSQLGDMAMAYYGDFVEVAFSETGKQSMLEDTQCYLEAAQQGRGPRNIAEASFAYDGNFCSVDILRIEDDGVHLVEVKSSTHIRDIYLHDMAFQCWVLEKCGLKVKTASLMHMNSKYVRHGEIDLQQLFVPIDCSDTVFSMLPQVEANILAFKETADQEDEPATEICPNCKSPYPCGYRQWCWRDIPSPSVFDLARIQTSRAFDLKDQGVLTYEQIEESGIKLSPRQKVQVDCELNNVEYVADVPAIREFLDTLTFPLYFLDFETFQPAVPLYDGCTPYMQIPTQYSLHVLRGAEAPLEHFEFLAPSTGDPRRSVAERLVADIPFGSCVLAYNMSFEKGRIKEMAEAFPDLSDHLLSLVDGMCDLLVPFQRGYCYYHAMGGSNSIKAVLPALFPNDSQLDYHGLTGVHNGAEASAAFENLASMSPEQEERTRNYLLKYCELDTLAMVKIWQKLVELSVEE